ncbi:hypothetical protein [Hoeflea poritis]|uniref:hypothetical protein n=1 Tax=Hoeflea poritis TaxID=2993659 RepID=UPI0022F04F40|nr:hypothetical protein [Hoeflea poritis]
MLHRPPALRLALHGCASQWFLEPLFEDDAAQRCEALSDDLIDLMRRLIAVLAYEVVDDFRSEIHGEESGYVVGCEDSSPFWPFDGRLKPNSLVSQIADQAVKRNRRAVEARQHTAVTDFLQADGFRISRRLLPCNTVNR